MHYSITLGTYMKSRVDNIINHIGNNEEKEPLITALQTMQQQYVLNNIPYLELFTTIKNAEKELNIDPPRLPEITKEEFLKMTKSPRKDVNTDLQLAFAEIFARCCVSRLIHGYDPYSVKIERMSSHPSDWYLYTVAAKRLKASEKGNDWAVWTLNISQGGLAHGHYDLTEKEVPGVFDMKRR